MSEKWEEVAHRCHRLKVFKGWIVETWAESQGGDRLAICFVPDQWHEWKLNENNSKGGE